MHVKPIITIDEIEHEILVPNPGGRKVLISPTETGYEDAQLIISECLPAQIPYEFIGLVEFPDGSVYPKYKANVVTTQSLWIRSIQAYKYGQKIINKICWSLTWQEGMLQAMSIDEADMKYFEYESEKLSYWVASPSCYREGNKRYFGPQAVVNGDVNSAYGKEILSDWCFISGGLPLRPTMILSSKVQVNDQENITWVSL